MKAFSKGQFQPAFTKFYFAIAFILAIAELLKSDAVVFILKPLLIPVLIFLYLYSSSKRNIWYVLCLFFAWISNISFLLASEKFVLYGFISFMFYRLICILLVYKLVKKIYLLPVIIATLPFLFVFSCLLNLTLGIDAPEFFPAVVNALLISALAGISLSNYIMSDNKINSWLAISTLLAVVLVFLFMIQKYYIENVVFLPISAIVFAFLHYTFYKFMLESEKSDK